MTQPNSIIAHLLRPMALTLLLFVISTGVATAQYDEKVPCPQCVTGGEDLDGNVAIHTGNSSKLTLASYPSPFNPETTIQFGLPEAQNVRIAVFNMLGQVVQVLVDDRLNAGKHQVRFTAHNLPSGRYLVRLETPTMVITHSMVLAK